LLALISFCIRDLYNKDTFRAYGSASRILDADFRARNIWRFLGLN
jgi:hypothetical protein